MRAECHSAGRVHAIADGVSQNRPDRGDLACCGVDPEEEQPPRRPPLDYRVVRDRLLDGRDRVVATALRVLQVDPAARATSFVPPTETVQLDVRRHPVVLVWPTLRTLTGLLLLSTGPRFVALLLFLAVTVASLGTRSRAGLRTSAVVGVGAAAVLVLAEPALGVVALLAWLAHDVGDWACDRLVVTDRRIYRRYGVVTAHSPSIALTAIAFLDAAVPPLGRVFRYGTLRLDSVAQRDAPLSRFDNVPDVVGVSHRVLELRSRAMPKYPPPVL